LAVWFSGSIVGNTIMNNSSGISMGGSQGVISGNTVSQNKGSGIVLWDSSPDIINNIVSGNYFGIYAYSASDPVINYNEIHGNSNYGVYNADRSVVINAENNWWGHESGPLDDSDDRSTGGLYNPDGQGDRVSDYVDYDPWTTTVVAPNIQVSVASCDFDSVAVGSYADRVFVVYNVGSASLSLNDIASTDTAFTIPSLSFPQDIPPGDSIGVVVRFSPAGAVSYNDTLVISSNDPDEPEVYIYMVGTGVLNSPPVASFVYSPAGPKVGQRATFDASSSHDPDGKIVSYEWDWDGDGTYDESTTDSTIFHTWNAAGTYRVTLKVTDNGQAADTVSKEITVSPLSDIGCAIIVVSKEDNRIKRWNFNKRADYTYDVLRSLGFSDDDIFYLNSNKKGGGVDADATLENLQEALTQWAPQRVGPSSPLILTMIGHGVEAWKGIFDLSEDESLNGSVLNGLLKTSPEGTKMLIVVDACYSGSFITDPLNSISSTDRVVLTSTRAGEEAYEPFFDAFSKRFWRHVRLQQGRNVRLAFIRACELYLEQAEPQFNDTGTRTGYDAKFLKQNPPESEGDPGFLAAGISIGRPGGPDQILKRLLWVDILSPGELRVYDSQGRVTGLVNGEVKEEVPNSIYMEDRGTVVIWPAVDSYRYEVVGTGTGKYGLRITSEDEEVELFTATGVPIAPGAVHRYTVDWEALSKGEKGVTVRIDFDGDGSFEQTVTTGNTLTYADVTSMVRVARFGIRYDRRTGEFSFNTNLTNTSDQSIFSPIRMVIDNIQPSSVSVINPDGTTEDGRPYFEFTIGDGELSPGEVSPVRRIVFSNPQRRRFRFDVIVFGGLSGVGVGKRVAQGGGLTMVVPVEFRLGQNRPNPFNSSTAISYDVAEPCRVILSVYDILGREVRRLVDGEQVPGSYTVVWDGRDELGHEVGSGIYLYRLRAGGFADTRKMMLIR